MDKASARPFGFWTATALVVGGMIGSGIFLVPSALAPFGWTGTLAWVVAIGGAITIAWTLSRLAQTMPEATGAITVAAAVVGPLAGLLIGWSYWVAVWSANAAIAIAATSYLAAVLPWLDATPLTGALVAVGLIWALTLLNVAGAKRAGEFQVVTTVLKLMPLIAVVVIAASLMTGGTVAVPPLPAPHMLLTGLAPAVTLTLFALVGFEAACAIRRGRSSARRWRGRSSPGCCTSSSARRSYCCCRRARLPRRPPRSRCSSKPSGDTVRRCGSRCSRRSRRSGR